MAAHDESYRLLFSHPRMIEDLLRGFVREPWVEELDFASLQRVSASYVSEHLEGREADMVWRVRSSRQDWLYVYLLLEFQSTVDRFMALRLLVYVGLLYQDLLRRGDLTPSGRLPPVLPLLLYNGQARWTAAREVSELIEDVPGGLARYCPQLSYLLLDQGRVSREDLPAVENLAGALVRLEQCRWPQDAAQVVGALKRSLTGAGEEGLGRAFAAWVRGAVVPARHWQEILDGADLQEVHSMLEQTARNWWKEAEEKGWKHGLERGLEEGREQGREQGLQQGLQQGLRTGEARLLLRQIEQRFGQPAPEQRARIEAADSEQLLRWGERVFAAGSLEEVLAD